MLVTALRVEGAHEIAEGPGTIAFKINPFQHGRRWYWQWSAVVNAGALTLVPQDGTLHIAGRLSLVYSAIAGVVLGVVLVLVGMPYWLSTVLICVGWVTSWGVARAKFEAWIEELGGARIDDQRRAAAI
jgi:hypothetical protein